MLITVLQVFAPNNDAFSDIASVDPTMIESILSYHISPVVVRQADLTTGTNHTIVPSLLQEPLLGMNQTAVSREKATRQPHETERLLLQPLVASFGVDGQPRIRTASQNVTVGANTTVGRPPPSMIIPDAKDASNAVL